MFFTFKLTQIVKRYFEIFLKEMLVVSMCFTLTILWKHTLFLGFSLLVKHSFERWREFLLNIFSKGERFVPNIMLLHAFFTGLIYFEEKKINLLTKSDGNFSLSEIFDFAIKRVSYKWRNCFSAKSFTDR